MANPTITGGLTPGELKVASFWVKHREMMFRLGYGFLIAVNALVWGYALWGILDAYAISYPRESRITQEIALNQIALAALEAERPQDIRTANSLVLETTDGRFDLAIDLTNPNAQWWAEFNYRFNFSGEQTPLRSGFILPGGQTVLTELGYRPQARGAPTAQVVVEDLRWHRVDPKISGADYPAYAAKVLNLEFAGVEFKRDVILDGRTIGRTTFDLMNRGSYGYWNLDLVVRVYRGTRVLGVNKISLRQVRPGETRGVALDWFEDLATITRTEIIPVVNIIDQSSFLPTEYFR